MSAKAIFVGALLVALASAAWPLHASFGRLFNSGSDSQVQLANEDATNRGSQLSVGIALHSSYGAVTVILDGPDGPKEVASRVVQGDAEYRERMAILSLEESRHLA